MSDIALGVTNFIRTDKLTNLFESIPTGVIGRVVVADNGNIKEEEKELYNRDWGFDVTVLDLPYDSGIGLCRKRIVSTVDEEYLLLLDNDMLFPSNFSLLINIMESESDYGGVSGILLENGNMRGAGVDHYEIKIGGDLILYLHNEEIPSPKLIDGAAVYSFDQIPQAGLFRTECFDAYVWNEGYQSLGEHKDFFVGQRKYDDWDFGVTPNVVIRHKPGGSAEYQNITKSNKRRNADRQLFLDSWEYDLVMYGESNWLETVSEKGYSSLLSMIHKSLPMWARWATLKPYRTVKPYLPRALRPYD